MLWCNYQKGLLQIITSLHVSPFCMALTYSSKFMAVIEVVKPLPSFVFTSEVSKVSTASSKFYLFDITEFILASWA